MKFCFIVPYYNEQSNGIRVLYQAALLFSQCAKNTSMKIYDSHAEKIIHHPNLNRVPSKFHNLISNKIEFSFDFVYVLPETPKKLPKNLPKEVKIVRYLLANPFFFNNSSVNYKDQFLLAYSYLISKKLPQLYINAFPDFPKIKRSKSKYDKALIYFGKFRLTQDFQAFSYVNEILCKFKEVEIIHRGYPKIHKDYLKKLNEVSLLISYDGLSSVNHEASLMGIKVVLVDDLFIKKSFNIKLYNIFSLDEMRRKKLTLSQLPLKNYTNYNTSKLMVINTIKMIVDFFNSKKRDQYNHLFEKELENLKIFAQENFPNNVISFNGSHKLPLLILFQFDKEIYNKIMDSLGKKKSKKIKIIFAFLLTFKFLKIRILSYLSDLVHFYILYKLKPKSFIIQFNNYCLEKAHSL
jgi:hypothetical protein